jgi:hypothetical protein
LTNAAADPRRKRRQVQALGLIDYAPGPYQKVITQILGVLVLVCRLRTAREQGE